jgi:hypothetical protein
MTPHFSWERWIRLPIDLCRYRWLLTKRILSPWDVVGPDFLFSSLNLFLPMYSSGGMHNGFGRLVILLQFKNF